MAGDPRNASLWGDADVLVGALDAEDPADIDTQFGSDWDLVGLLDGEAGFGTSREEEMSDLYAWGGALVRTSRRQFKMTKTFTLLEDNDATRGLIWPGSTESEIFVPRPVRIKIAFELREGTTAKERMISAFAAEVWVDGDITENEADLTKYPMRAVIYPDTTSLSPTTGAPKLFNKQKTALASV